MLLNVDAAGAQSREVSLAEQSGFEWVSTLPPFLRDSEWDLHLRSYYLGRRNFNGSASEAWAGGGWIGWKSGFAADIFQIGATVYTSQPLYAPSDRPGSGLLDASQNGITTLGQAWVLARYAGHDLVVGRQVVDTPLLNLRDSRMIPITFEGVTLKSTPDPDRWFSYQLGYLREFRQRDSQDFESMSAGLGVTSVDRGAFFGIVRAKPVDGLNLTAMDYFIEDTINAAFGEVKYEFPHEEGGPIWAAGVNIIHQSSVGADLLTGDPFSTWQASAQLSLVARGFRVSLSGSTTGEGADIRAPFGSKPNFTDMQQVSFDRAGEDAIVIAASYDFGEIGWDGLSAGASYGHGVNAMNASTGASLPVRDEYDVFVQYRPPEGSLKGFRFQAKYADVLSQGAGVRDHQPETRIILDYSVLLKP